MYDEATTPETKTPVVVPATNDNKNPAKSQPKNNEKKPAVLPAPVQKPKAILPKTGK